MEVKRLFGQFNPSKYTLDIIINREAMTFTGTVVATGKRRGKPSSRLTFHQKGLTVTAASISRRDKKGIAELSVDRINNHGKYDEVRLHTSSLIYPGDLSVTMKFKGKITRQMNGIYPCFFNVDGKDKKIIATQFESHHAREVFPCIDEPEAKAEFQLTLHHPSGETAISNTPIISQKQAKVLTTTTFETTPVMSTYLLAFVCGDLHFLEAKTKQGVIIRTYATPGNVKHTKFALDVAVKCLEFYNDYFGIGYPLAKCDLIALPDFAAGAMENWGCITFREQAMLVDPENTSLGSQQYVALVVAHELTHQWFGNLVTMRWWTDLWLNEGFASWMEYLAVDSIYPDWQLWTQFIVDEQQQALKLDALENTHPVEVPVRHPDEIRTIFDAISYSKGASVIHMLQKYLGPEPFRDGLRHYLKKHQYNNTDTKDLWISLERITGKPVQKFMDTWTTQPGFPLVNADVGRSEIKICQSRFFMNAKSKQDRKQIWPIPLLAGQSLPDTLTGKSAASNITADEPIKINTGQGGFFRTVYNSNHLERLGSLIEDKKIPAEDRLGIISDVFEAAKAGYCSTADALNFLNHYKQEDNYAVWDCMVSAIGSLRLVMDDEQLREDMKPYLRQLVTPQLKRLSWDRMDSDHHFDRLLRPLILGLAASADEPEIIKKCTDLFSKIEDVEDVQPHLRAPEGAKNVKRGIDIDPDLRGTVFGTVARLGGEKQFNKLLKLHNQSSMSEERLTLAAALTGFKQQSLIKRSLELISSDDVRLQDASYWIAYSFLNRHAKKATWGWIKDNWKWLQDNLGTDLSFYRMPIYTARVFSDGNFIKEYEEFFLPKMSPALDRSYKQGHEMLHWQSAWKNRALNDVAAFFKSHA